MLVLVKLNYGGFHCKEELVANGLGLKIFGYFLHALYAEWVNGKLIGFFRPLKDVYSSNPVQRGKLILFFKDYRIFVRDYKIG